MRSEVIGDFQEPYGAMFGEFAKVYSSIQFIPERRYLFG